MIGTALMWTGPNERGQLLFFFSSRRRHTISLCDWSSDVCSSDLGIPLFVVATAEHRGGRDHDQRDADEVRGDVALVAVVLGVLGELLGEGPHLLGTVLQK